MFSSTPCPKCLDATQTLFVEVRYDPTTDEIINKPGLFDAKVKKDAYEKAPKGTALQCRCGYQWRSESPGLLMALPSIDLNAPIERAPRPQTVNATPSADVEQWLKLLSNGSQKQANTAFRLLLERRPPSSLPGLIQFTKGKTTDLRERMIAATLALAAIGDSSVVKALTSNDQFRVSGEYICYALGEIGDPAGLEYLRNYTKSGDFASRAQALAAQGKIGHASALVGLIQDVEHDFNDSYYQETTANPLLSERSTGWRMLGLAAAAMEHRASNKWAAQNATLMTDSSLSLSDVAAAPPDVRRMWQFHLRVKVLEQLVARHGKDALLAQWPKAKQSIKRLMIALPLLNLYGPDQEWIDCLQQSTRSHEETERVLAYEKLIQLAANTHDSRYVQLATTGFNDSEDRVRAALATAVILHQVSELIPSALALASDKSSDMRMSMVYPVVRLARYNDPRGVAALNALKQDRDGKIRDRAEELGRELSG